MGISATAVIAVALFWYLTVPSVDPRITPTHELVVGSTTVRIAIADTPESRARGLSGTVSLDPDEGMLFVFEADGRHAFWMKDMRYPIDMIWIDAAGSVVHIEHDVSPDTYPQSFMPDLPARYVLEVPAGFATEHGIGVGSKSEFPL